MVVNDMELKMMIRVLVSKVKNYQKYEVELSEEFQCNSIEEIIFEIQKLQAICRKNVMKQFEMDMDD